MTTRQPETQFSENAETRTSPNQAATREASLQSRRILLGAFVCAPGLGSEEGVGWGIARTLADLHRVHVLTTPRHRPAIEAQLAKSPCPNLSFSYHDFPPWILRGVVTSSLWQIYYHAWQLKIGAWGREIAESFKPDIVHHVTYGRYWTPTTLWRLGRPFVWGPLGGGDKVPKAFSAIVPGKERIVGLIRSLAQWTAERDPTLRKTARNCDLALASTPATAARLHALGAKRTQIFMQNALDHRLIAREATEAELPPMFCTVGRLLGWKAQILAIRAFARAGISQSRLIVIGDGPLRKWLTRSVGEMGLTEQVIFTGALSREATMDYMKRSIALVHSSLHDQAPTVVFEAMACSKPIIALALGGLPIQVPANGGHLIAADSIEQGIQDIARAMVLLSSDRRQRLEMGQRARDYVADNFTWVKKAELFSLLYEELLDEKNRRSLPAAVQPTLLRKSITNSLTT